MLMLKAVDDIISSKGWWRIPVMKGANSSLAECLCVSVCVCVCACVCLCVLLYSYLCEDQVESTTNGLRTFWESEDIWAGPYFVTPL